MLATFLQNELMLLSTEAKRKHPEIKDAAEKLLFLIRSLKENSLDLNIELSKTQDTIQPFLLSFETKNLKLISIAVGCVQKLISHNAIPISSLEIVLKSLADPIINTQDLQLKILQTILPLVTNYSIHGNTLSMALVLCFRLYDSKVNVVSSSAVATFRQLILFAFEKLLEKAKITPRSNVVDLSLQIDVDMKELEKDTLLIFQDVCALTAGEPGTFLKINAMSRNLGLELIESIITTCDVLFEMYPELLSLIREKICPLVIKYFSEKAEFSLTVRLMRVCKSLVMYFNKTLSMQCEVFLSLFSKILESNTFPNWQRILVLECYKSFSSDGELQRNLFNVYDTNQQSANIYTEMTQGICSVIFGAHNYLFFYSESPQEPFALSTMSSAMKIPCIEQLEKTECPVFPDSYPILLAFQSLTHLVETLSDFILPIMLNRNGQEQSFEKEIFLAIEMAKAAGPALWYALTILAVSSVDDEIFQRVLKSIERYCAIVGLLGLSSYRDSILGTLCRVGITSQLPIEMNYNELPKELPPFTFMSIQVRNQMFTLSDRNIHFLVCMIQATELMTDVMDSKSWFVVLETLQSADFLLFSRAFKRLESMNTMTDLNPPQKEQRNRSNTGAIPHATAFMESYITKPHLHPSTENIAAHYASVAKKMYESTMKMKPRIFMEFLRALCRLAQETISNLSTQNNTNNKDIKVVDEKSFAITKILETMILNIKRLTNPKDFSVFDLIVTQLTNVAQSPICSTGIRNQVCTTFGDIIVSISQDEAFQEVEIELHALESIKNLMALDLKTPTEQTPEHEMLVRSFLPEVRRLGMDIVNRLLQTSGQYIKTGWLTLFDIIYHTLQSSNSVRKAKLLEQSRIAESSMAIPAVMSPGIGVAESPISMEQISVAPKAGTNTLKVGFSCIQLICTDFMSNLSPVALSKCIETVAAFGSISDDLNISLTAVGLLWSLCDYILTTKQKLEKEQVDVVGSPEKSNFQVASEPDLESLGGPITSKTMDTLWMYLLRKLSDLCSDDRPEVRNSANQTLFRTIAMNGERLTLASWEMCINHVLFPLLEKITDVSTQSPAKANNLDKQWNESKILTLGGVTKCLTDFLPVLIELIDFDEQWLVFLNFYKTTCLYSTQEVALAALKNFKILVQYLKPSDQPLPDNVLKKVDFLASKVFQVWIAFGQGIIDGADESNWVETEKVYVPIVEWSNDRKPHLLQGPFSQDCLSQYCSVFFELYPIIQSSFGLVEFDKVTDLWQDLILYHSKPPAGATQSKLRSDIVNDVDTMTPTQSQFIDFLTGKVEFKGIDGIDQLIFVLLADLTTLPFIPFAIQCVGKTEAETKVPCYTSPFLKKHSFIAISRKAFTVIQSKYEALTEQEALYSSGAFEHILVSLQLPLQYKYDCPFVGNKDTTPLWKTAIIITKRLLSDSLFVLFDLEDHLEPFKLKSLYSTIIESLETFLLCKCQPSNPISSDQYAQDEKIDLDLIEFIKNDAIVFFGRPQVKTKYLERLLKILVRIVGDDLHPEPVVLDFKPPSPLQNTVSSVKITSPEMIPMSPVHMPDMESLQLGPDQLTPTKENIATKCLETLFYICSEKTPGVDSDIRAGNVCLPLLLEKCKQILEKYMVDKKATGKFPMTRSRNSEIIHILNGLNQLVLRPGLVEPCHGPITKEMIKLFLGASPFAHLYEIYPTLCEFLCVVSGSIFNAPTTGEFQFADEAMMVDLVNQCLAKIGQLFQ